MSTPIPRVDDATFLRGQAGYLDDSVPEAGVIAVRGTPSRWITFREGAAAA